MSDIYVELPEFKPLDISKDDVETCADVPTLLDWFERLNESNLQTTEFLHAYRDAQVDDEDWFRRTGGRLAYVRIAARWVERRLLTLGAKVPYPPTDPRTRQLRILDDKICKLKAEIDRLTMKEAA